MKDEIERLEARADSLVDAHTALLEQLVELRHRHDMSQASVAERMGVSQPAVSSFEHYDSNPTLSTIRRYALAVGARIKIEVVDDCASDVQLAGGSTKEFEAIVVGIKSTIKSMPQRNRGTRWGVPKTQNEGVHVYG